MRNSHPGQCYRCGEWVLPGHGHFELIGDRQRALYKGHLPHTSRWLTQHDHCQRKYQGMLHHFAIATEVLTERLRQFEEDQAIAKQVQQETDLALAHALGWEGSNPASARRFLKRTGHRK